MVKPRGWTSTPSVAMYFFSNSPVKWRLTKVVCGGLLVAHFSRADGRRRLSQASQAEAQKCDQRANHSPFRYHRRRQARA